MNRVRKASKKWEQVREPALAAKTRRRLETFVNRNKALRARRALGTTSGLTDVTENDQEVLFESSSRDLAENEVTGVEGDHDEQ